MRTLSVIAAFVLVLAACSDDDTPSESPTVTPIPTSAPPTPSPVPTLPVLVPREPIALPTAASTDTPAPSATAIPLPTLGPATYRTATFTPAVTFTIADGWSVVGETERSVTLSRRTEPDNIVLTIDSANSEPIDIAISRFSTISGTSAGDITDTTVAGFPAQEFDIEIDDAITPVNHLDQPYTALRDDRLHFWIIDVNGALVKIIAEAPENDFESYLALVRETVETVSFE